MVERNGVLELQYIMCNSNGTKIELAFICRSADSSVDRCHVTLFLIDVFYLRLFCALAVLIKQEKIFIVDN